MIGSCATHPVTPRKRRCQQPHQSKHHITQPLPRIASGYRHLPVLLSMRQCTPLHRGMRAIPQQEARPPAILCDETNPIPCPRKSPHERNEPNSRAAEILPYQPVAEIVAAQRPTPQGAQTFRLPLWSRRFRLRLALVATSATGCYLPAANASVSETTFRFARNSPAVAALSTRISTGCPGNRSK